MYTNSSKHTILCIFLTALPPPPAPQVYIFFQKNTCLLHVSVYPQIAISIGVLTSNKGEGDEPLWRIGPGTRVPLQGAVDVVPLLGAIVVFYAGGRGG